MLNRIKEVKKGFTLVEVIVVLVLISLVSVGSIVGVKVYKNNSNDKFYKQFDDALEIYLSDHSEIYSNLSDNVEGAVVTLEVLKNEGLIKDNIIVPSTDEVIDYTNNYYVLSDAVLLENTPAEGENACEGQVELSVISSWGVLSGKVDTSNIIYICPKEDTQKVKEEDIEELKKRLESLESQLSTLNLGGDNWILFDVNTNQSALAYWPEENQDLWAYVGINNSKKEIKLIYNNYTGVNNTKSLVYTTDSNFPSKCTRVLSKQGNRYKTFEGFDKSLVKLLDLSKSSYGKAYNDWSEWNGILEYNGDYYYYKYNWNYSECSLASIYAGYEFYYNTNFGPLTKIDNDNAWTKYEIETEKYDTSNSKKKALYDAIKDTSNIVTKKYYYSYNVYSDGINLKPTSIKPDIYYEDKLGNFNSIEDDIKNIRSSLVGLNFYIGSYGSMNMNGYVLYSNGDVSYVDINDNYDNNSYDFYYTYSQYDNDTKKNHQVWNPPYSTYYTEVNTINYVPVITIKYNSLMTDINAYPDSYKTKYSGCTNDDLGKKDCPYIIKMANGNLSWS